MTEEIKALIFISFIVAIPIILMIKFSNGTSLKKDVKLWAGVWVATTLLAFLSQNFWIYAFFLSISLIYFTRTNHVLRICLFFVLLPSLPAAVITIPGFGLITYLLNIGHHHLLSIVLLLPLAIRKSRGLNTSRMVNFLVIIYVLLQSFNWLRDSTVTDTLRLATMLTISILIPYFAISKTVSNFQDFRKIMFAIAFGVIIQASIGIAETLKGWHLYNAVEQTLGIDWGYGSYLSRNNLLRASAALGHPIVLGYICAIGLGMLLQFYPTERKLMVKYYWFFLLLICGGLTATLSRGPWVGAALVIFIFIVSEKKAIGNLTKLGFVTLGIFAVLSLTPLGQSFIDLIPFVGGDSQSAAASTISYRQRLMTQSWIVMQQNLFFGSADFMEAPELQSLRQGQGIIDIVNSYVSIMLGSGLVGLSIFVSAFLIPVFRLYKLLPALKEDIRFQPWLTQNRVLLATLCGIMFTIFTTSSIGVIPMYNWAMVGLSCAYIKAARTEILKHYMNIDKKPVYT